MKLHERYLDLFLAGRTRRWWGRRGVAVALAAALVLTPACGTTGQDPAKGAAALADLATAPLSGQAPRSPVPLPSPGPAEATSGVAEPREALKAAPEAPAGAAAYLRPSPRTTGAARPDWHPEAAPAFGGTGASPSDGADGASAATTPPGPVEVLPGPSTPERPGHERAAAHGPVPVMSSRAGESPPADVAAAILDAYTAFWDSYWAAAAHPVNPQHPGIARHSTEPLRSRTVGVLLGRAGEGIALRLPADHGAGRIVQIEGWDSASAEVLDCFVDSAVLYEVATGRVRNDEQATVVHLGLLRRSGDAWRVAEIFEQATHTGRTSGCIIQHSTPEPPTPTGGPAAPTAGAASAPLTPSWLS